MGRKSQLFALLKKYRQDKITGKVVLQTTDFQESRFMGRVKWQLYLFMGQIVWINGGVHSHRSWLRHLIVYFCEVDIDKIKFREEEIFECYQYHLLRLMLQRNLAKPEQIKAAIENRIKEIFFDILQQEATTPIEEEIQEITPHSFLDSGFKPSAILPDTEQLLLQSQEYYFLWQQKIGLNILLEQAPVVIDREKLKKHLKPAIYQKFARLFDGHNTLRDLACKLNKDEINLTLSLIPYIARKSIKCIDIADLPKSCTVESYKSGSSNLRFTDRHLLVGCIDDSSAVCRTMEQILTQAGYKFIGIQNPLQAVPKMVSTKPDFIFVDIGMPMMNGYEVCTQLKKVSQLKDVPVVMLTGRDGIPDLLRAKFAGASDFIDKPIVEKTILETLEKFVSLKENTEAIDRHKLIF